MAGKGRKFTPDDKLKILEEARQPGNKVAEVPRRHQLDANTFYRWEKQAREGMRAAFTTVRGNGESSAKDREIERLKAELVKKSRIIAEVIEENLEPKRNSETRDEDALHGGRQVRGLSCTGGSGAGRRARSPAHGNEPRAV